MEDFIKRKELAVMREQFSNNLEALQALGDANRQNILIGIMQERNRRRWNQFENFICIVGFELSGNLGDT